MSDSSDPMDCSLLQAPPSMGFSRQKYWSGVPLPSPVCIYMCVYICVCVCVDPLENQVILICNQR